MKILLTINGNPYAPEVRGDETLLSYLRNELRLTGTKNGCGEGHCGACTVILDGRARLACRQKLTGLDNCKVETIESLRSVNEVHALIYGFVTAGAIQCGFCTPGFIMASKALLDENPNPTEKDIKKALAANLCRCTGYVKIIDAVKQASELIRGGKTWINRSDIIPAFSDPFGKSVPRVDGLGKATGELLFADDLVFDGMLHTKVLRSEYPHAAIEKVDISAALKIPGVAAVLTAPDVPGRNRFGPIFHDQPVFAEDRVRYLGDALAGVFAESEEIAEEAVSLIRVDYRPLPVVSTWEEATASDGPLLHAPERKSNIFARMESGKGRVDEGFGEADFILEGDYSTQYVEHAYMEPESCVARVENDGRLSVYVACQGPEADIKEMAPVLGLDPERIHIAHMPMGGGFGGKEDISVQIIAALGALKTGRPVKYTYTRRESIRTSGKRNAQRLLYKTGVKKDGTITAFRGRIRALAGAYASVEEAVILRSVSFAGGPYLFPHADVVAEAAYCNNMPSCAMRGFGNPPGTFAAEMQINRIAEELHIDPFDIRLKNALEAGKQSLTGERISASVGIRDCLLSVRAALEKTSLPEPPDGWKRGVGVAASYKNVGFGLGMDDSAGAYCEIIEDGKLLLRVGCVDMGQGALTAAAQFLSHAIGWPYDRIIVRAADTDRDPRSGMTTASRQTFLTGNAVLMAAKKLKNSLGAFLESELSPGSGGFIIKDGSIFETDSGKPIVSLPELSAMAQRKGVKLYGEDRYKAPATHLSLKEPAGGYPPGENRLHAAYCFAAHAVILDVNTDTGKLDVRKVIAASDVGRAANPAAVEGQIEGGVIMGLGYALSEEFKIEKGFIKTDTLGKLGLRRIGQTPEIEAIIIDSPHPDGPYGAKGMAELPLSPVAPALAHAIYRAAGVWIYSLPITSEKILAALLSARQD